MRRKTATIENHFLPLACWWACFLCDPAVNPSAAASSPPQRTSSRAASDSFGAARSISLRSFSTCASVRKSTEPVAAKDGSGEAATRAGAEKDASADKKTEAAAKESDELGEVPEPPPDPSRHSLPLGLRTDLPSVREVAQQAGTLAVTAGRFLGYELPVSIGEKVLELAKIAVTSEDQHAVHCGAYIALPHFASYIAAALHLPDSLSARLHDWMHTHPHAHAVSPFLFADPRELGPIFSRMWSHLRAELEHYYLGFRLFFLECRTATSLVTRMAQGYELSRRERKQLVRTTGDVFRMVPFVIFIVVPFMEFLLPVVVSYFPGMLPSTF